MLKKNTKIRILLYSFQKKIVSSFTFLYFCSQKFQVYPANLNKTNPNEKNTVVIICTQPIFGRGCSHL